MLKHLSAILCLWIGSVFANQAYVTYGSCGGRFGDQVLHYLHAKWLSYQNDIPLLYRPSPYLADLTLAQTEVLFQPFYAYPRRTINLFSPIFLSPHVPWIYECPYFPAFEEEQIAGHWGGFPVDWKDPTFRALAIAAITPTIPLILTSPPKDAVSIAMHIREGGGFDDYEQARLGDPLKFPPLSFYVEALQRTLSFLHGKKVYCHLFTDCPNPENLAIQLKEAIDQDIFFGYRKEGNHHAKNVLEDFFSFFSFDILIRPRSNFSIVPSLLTDYALLCYPTAFIQQGTTVTITQMSIETNDLLLGEIGQK